jgi:hypothetical protein
MRGFFSAASSLAPVALASSSEPRNAHQPVSATPSKSLPADSLVASLFSQHASVPSLQVLSQALSLLHPVLLMLTTLRVRSGI